ncbi:ATP-dependent Zn protease [Leptodesmis sichuanensis]|uniref:ATP-dependent Zn protease n=1 Tax=Leptodesmis sichuanensis TaxID=2906798 RepID=UPI001F39151E|nr:ATP-dependent Zn protease [Leptodesmis sichuanensis]UIE39025.1 ATP-dependent Zn protease [Leptodesmis sichuanensis A121]
MGQLSLNLVAISVFVMTMSVLLGPLLNLSPVVPAIATVTVLGMATLDSLNWQGKGGTLILDWIARFSPEYRSRIVRHEAGHFLVAHHLGLPVTGYTLSAWEAFRQGQSGQGGVQVDAQALESELQQGKNLSPIVDRYCTVWMAGAAAEKLVYGAIQGGADDVQKVRSLLSYLKLSPTERQQKERWATLRAKTLLQDHWATYEQLVAAMEQRASVVECQQLLNHSPTSCPTPNLHFPNNR